MLHLAGNLRREAARAPADRRARVDYELSRLAEILAFGRGQRTLARALIDGHLSESPAWPWPPTTWIATAGPTALIGTELALAAAADGPLWALCARWPAFERDPVDAQVWRWRFSSLYVATDLARLDLDRQAAFRRQGELRAWLARGSAAGADAGTQLELDYLCTQLEAHLYLAFGLADLAAERVQRLEALAQQRFESGALDEITATEDFFYVAQLVANVRLSTERAAEVAARLREFERDPRFKGLDAVQRAELELIAIRAELEDEQARGLGSSPRPSPLASLLEPGRFAALSADQRSVALLLEAQFQLERGSRPAAEQAFAQWQALQGSRPSHALGEVEALAFELRRLGQDLDAGQLPGRAQLERFEARFLEQLSRWSADSSAGASAFLQYHFFSTCLTELAIAHGALDGQPGWARALELHAQVLRQGGLATRLGVAPPAPGDPLPSADPLAHSRGDARLKLCYFRGIHRSLLVWFADGEARAVRLGSGDRIDAERLKLEGALARLMRTGGQVGWREFEAARAALSQLLLPPELLPDLAAAVSAGRSVALIGPQTLGFLPFEVLEWAPGRALGFELAFEYWPSLDLERALAGRGQPPDRGGVLLLSRTAAIPEGLPAAAAFEVPEVGFWPWRAHLAELDFLREADANLEALAHGAPRHGVCWLVAHGAFDPEQSPAAALVLPRADGSAPLLSAASPAWGGAEGWPELRFAPGSLLVLATCGAWRAPQRRGDDGSESLAARLLEHGARGVLLSYHELRFADHARLAQALLERWTAAGDSSLAASLASARSAAAAASDDALGRLAPLLFHAYGAPGPAPRLQPRFEGPLAPWARQALRQPSRLLGGLLLIAAAALLASAALTARGRRRAHGPKV